MAGNIALYVLPLASFEFVFNIHWPEVRSRYIVPEKKEKKKEKKKEHGQQRNNKNKNSIPIHTNPTNATRTHDVTRSLTQCW